MTETEFKSFMADCHRRFPDSFRWFTARQEGETDEVWKDRQRQTNRGWFDCVSDLDIADHSATHEFCLGRGNGIEDAQKEKDEEGDILDRKSVV